jgi:fructosamine-3-kinase
MDINKISKCMSKALRENIVIISMEKISEGLHSDGFKLTASNGKKYFLKKNKSFDLGFSTPERRLSSFMLNHRMANRMKEKPLSIGVFLENESEIVKLKELKDDTLFFNIQEFEDLGDNYFQTLIKRKNKQSLDNEDITEVDKIVDYLIRLHSIKYVGDDNLKKIIYNDSLRTIFTHPELTFTFLQRMDKEVMSLELQKEIVNIMLDIMHNWRDKSYRLVAIHGDFWVGNIFFKENKNISLIDHSRIPWGDPGIDLGWLIAQYISFYTETNNKYFKELGEI